MLAVDDLPAAFEDAGACTAVLQRLRDNGHRGLVVADRRRTAAVMTAMVRTTPTGGRYARLPPEGFAVDPDLADPTGVLAAAFADLASPLIASGVLRFYLVHAALPRLSEALSNLGFGRNGVYGIQPTATRRGSCAVAVRLAGAGDLDAVARPFPRRIRRTRRRPADRRADLAGTAPVPGRPALHRPHRYRARCARAWRRARPRRRRLIDGAPRQPGM